MGTYINKGNLHFCPRNIMHWRYSFHLFRNFRKIGGGGGNA